MALPKFLEKYQEEFTFVTDNNLLPTKSYIAVKRFTEKYENTGKFWDGIGSIAIDPIFNGLTACYYALRAVWATLRAVGNLLVLKPGDALDAIKDAGFHLTMSICLAVMAPIHALTNAVELLTRTVSSWFRKSLPVESVESAENPSYLEQFAEQAGQYTRNMIPSASYFGASRFFLPYKDANKCLAQMASPFVMMGLTGFNSLYEAYSGVNSALECIANLLIGKPKEALKDLKDLSIHFTLAVSLAVMTPINFLVEGIAFLTRTGSTWYSACTQPKANTLSINSDERGEYIYEEDTEGYGLSSSH
ncbi:hypothetical protein [Legionella waltersii]|uniref:Substrate of the Dot/Icm secretion system n=1 Tax=Legionella waltersii TaxID=66969 RepID=A0A0W1ADN5_9GAMM|nr:hypothetical protein [Legionella waltersii]KTD79432.1 substrate of the Dot/Icm secretion system [Legionella waltersii]SNU97683.1 Dot/Icm secretion system substrate [Legionella waltersii]